MGDDLCLCVCVCCMCAWLSGGINTNNHGPGGDEGADLFHVLLELQLPLLPVRQHLPQHLLAGVQLRGRLHRLIHGLIVIVSHAL